MNKKIRDNCNIIVNWLDRRAPVILGFFCFLYAQFVSKFAELHIKLWFLDFPIFIGEILLAFYIILFIRRCKIGMIRFKRWHILLLLYVFFILFKAFYGYSKWGALAFRNAALFYNTLFIVVSYYLFKAGLVKSKFVYTAMLVILVAAVYLYPPCSYFTYTYLMLIIALLLHLIHIRKIKYIAISLVLISFPYKILFVATRGEIVSGAFAFLLLLICLLLTYKIKVGYKIIIFLASLVIFGLFSHLYVGKSDLRSLISPRYVIRQYEHYAKLIDARKDEFGQMRDMQVLVYDNNKTGLYATPETIRKMGAKAAREAEKAARKAAEEVTRKAEALRLEALRQQEAAEEAAAKKIEATKAEAEALRVETPRRQKEAAAKKIEAAKAEAEALRVETLRQQKAAEEAARNEAEAARRKAEEIAKKEAEEQAMWIEQAEVRTAAEAKLAAKNAANLKATLSQKDYIDANVSWRIFVWKDMYDEFMENIFRNKWNIFGLDFGKPFRSKSIEILRWSDGGWVGWIEPHNSYLHILYRAGIIGLLFIIIIWGLFIRMLVLFIRIRDIKGALVCSALSYWFAIANFEVILELPYFAIPLWSLFGITLAYYYKVKR